VSFATGDLFGGVVALVGEVDLGGGLDRLRVEYAGAGVGVAPLAFSDEPAEEARELVEDAVGLPFGEVSVDGLV
jgi:hypothetical protein